eukprot:360653-Chlamydomonas_euryale.AAC.1
MQPSFHRPSRPHGQPPTTITHTHTTSMTVQSSKCAPARQRPQNQEHRFTDREQAHLFQAVQVGHTRRYRWGVHGCTGGACATVQAGCARWYRQGVRGGTGGACAAVQVGRARRYRWGVHGGTGRVCAAVQVGRARRYRWGVRGGTGRVCAAVQAGCARREGRACAAVQVGRARREGRGREAACMPLLLGTQGSMRRMCHSISNLE